MGKVPIPVPEPVLGICHLLAPAPGSGLSNSWLRLRAPGFKNLGSGSGLRPFKILAPAPEPRFSEPLHVGSGLRVENQ